MIDLRPLKVGLFLGYRQLIRASLWTNVLIVVIMVLTFLNLVVTSGILVGLIEGATVAVKHRYTGDVIITKLQENLFIENSRNIISTIEQTPGVKDYTPRYIASGSIEANYKQRTNFSDAPEKVSTIIAGINPLMEDKVTDISETLIEGEYLEDTDFDQVIVGAFLLKKYLELDSPGFMVLEDVEIGDKLRLTIGDNVREVKVKGVLRSKTDEIDRRVFMLDTQLRSIMGRSDLNVGEIAMIVEDGVNPDVIRDSLNASGAARYAKIQTSKDAEPKFITDIKKTFNMLGTIISSIGLAVAAITIFIVIFINAITRKKYIGIMKAIGISGHSIELAYVFQSLIYAIVGSAIGLIVVYAFLIPYIDANPINFPFSDGVLVAPVDTTLIRIAILILVTAVAGYIPAKIVVKKNTLDSILGR